MNFIYLLGSLAGVGLLVGLNYLMAGKGQVRVDLEMACALLAREHPGFCARQGAGSADGASALIEDEAGALYLVVAAGADLVSRKLTATSLKAPTRDGARLHLELDDFTFPQANLTLETEAAASEWQQRLVALRKDQRHGQALDQRG
jgi:hypothetical protein